MHGPLRVALVLLLVVGTTAAAAPFAAQPNSDEPSSSAGAPPVVQSANTSARLVLPDDRIQTVRFGTATLDVGGSLAMDNSDIHAQYATIRLREAFAEAGDDEAARRAVVVRSANRLDQRIDDLVARERAALEAYNDGELSTQAYLRELAAIQSAAESTRSTIDQLYTYDRAVGMPVPPDRISRMKSRLIPLTGPVRSRISSAISGDGEAIRVYVETSESGFVLSIVQVGQFDTQYTREAYFGGGLDDQWTDKPLSIDEFERRLSELYPWVYSTDPGVNTVLTSVPYYERSGIYGIAINHPQGTNSNRDLTVYYDAGTQDVFYEVQRLDVSQLPTTELANETDEGLRIRVRGIHADGPLLVNVTDATTGERVGATVTLNRDTVGSSARGGLWVVAPSGTFTVTATSQGRNVSATVPNFS